MAYGDLVTGEELLSTVIDFKSEEFKKAWNAGKGEMLSLSGSLSDLSSEAVDLILKVVVNSAIEHMAYGAFSKTDMRGEGWAWDFFVQDGIVPLVKPYLDAGRKIRIVSTAHWRASDAGEYGKFLSGNINDFVISPVEEETEQISAQ